MSVGEVVSMGPICRPDKLRRQPAEEGAYTGHAGADEAEVNLDIRPLINGDVIPCGVGRVSETNKVLEAKNADNCHTG